PPAVPAAAGRSRCRAPAGHGPRSTRAAGSGPAAAPGAEADRAPPATSRCRARGPGRRGGGGFSQCGRSSGHLLTGRRLVAAALRRIGGVREATRGGSCVVPRTVGLVARQTLSYG